eukprot:gene10554-biopygen11072
MALTHTPSRWRDPPSSRKAQTFGNALHVHTSIACGDLHACLRTRARAYARDESSMRQSPRPRTQTWVVVSDEGCICRNGFDMKSPGQTTDRDLKSAHAAPRTAALAQLPRAGASSVSPPAPVRRGHSPEVRRLPCGARRHARPPPPRRGGRRRTQAMRGVRGPPIAEQSLLGSRCFAYYVCPAIIEFCPAVDHLRMPPASPHLDWQFPFQMGVSALLNSLRAAHFGLRTWKAHPRVAIESRLDLGICHPSSKAAMDDSEAPEEDIEVRFEREFPVEMRSCSEKTSRPAAGLGLGEAADLVLVFEAIGLPRIFATDLQPLPHPSLHSHLDFGSPGRDAMPSRPGDLHSKARVGGADAPGDGMYFHLERRSSVEMRTCR